MKSCVFFLEGISEKEMLEGFLPRLLKSIGIDNIKPHYFTFNGKHGLKKNLVNRLRYWQRPKSVFVILIDQDTENCKDLKTDVLKLCHKAKRNAQFIVRIACHELESWYFGDLPALAKGLKNDNLYKHQNKQKYRNPDKIQHPSKELEQITKGMYQKISGSRAIGKHLSLNENMSHSFQIFIKGLRMLLQKDV